jgi:hypothetical protein
LREYTTLNNPNKKAALKRAAVNKERDLLKSLAIERKYAYALSLLRLSPLWLLAFAAFTAGKPLFTANTYLQPQNPNASPTMNAKGRRYLILLLFSIAVLRTPELRRPKYADFLE